MRTLDWDSFSDALIQCNRCAHYRVGIVFNKFSDLVAFAEEFNRIFVGERISGVQSVRVTPGGACILFYNNSKITMFTMQEASCGQAFHEIIIDEEITDDYRIEIIRSLAHRYLSDPRACESEPDFDNSDTSELDEFLDTFRVQE